MRPCLIELLWLDHKPVSPNSSVWDHTQNSYVLGQNTIDRAQPSQIQVRMRETYIVDRRYQLAVLVRFDCTTNRIP